MKARDFGFRYSDAFQIRGLVPAAGCEPSPRGTTRIPQLQKLPRLNYRDRERKMQERGVPGLNLLYYITFFRFGSGTLGPLLAKQLIILIIGIYNEKFLILIGTSFRIKIQV